MIINIPNDVKYILNTLSKNGFEAFIVGGCVRDSFLNKTPSDWDITTNALPFEVKKLFPVCIETGIVHGTVIVPVNGANYEITTYRIDGEYENFRKPMSVRFTKNITEDLARRDFTVNAMAYSEAEGLIDPFDGMSDINKGIIRCVGEADKRFNEDALRMLRAIRFNAQTGFDIDEEIIASIKRNSRLIRNISSERIRDELNKILMSDNPFAIKTLYDTGLLCAFLPELCVCFETDQNIKYHIYDVGMHTLHVVAATPKVLYLKYAALLHDIGKPEKKTTDENGIDHFKCHEIVSAELGEKIMKRLKLDNVCISKAVRLIKYHDREISETKSAVKRAVLSVGEDIFIDLLAIKIADARGQNPTETAARPAQYKRILNIYDEIKKENEALSVKDLAINGNDVAELGFFGKNIGFILNKALLYVIENPNKNTKQDLISYINKNKNIWII